MKEGQNGKSERTIIGNFIFFKLKIKDPVKIYHKRITTGPLMVLLK